MRLYIFEDMVEARYTVNKKAILKRANLRLEKIRVLLRLCHKMSYLSYKSYEYAMRLLNEVGKMLGGWIKHEQGKTV